MPTYRPKLTIVYDTTVPSTPSVTDGDYTNDNTQLTASWSSADAESGIDEFQYALGTMPGGSDVVGWTSAGTSMGVTKMGLSLSDGTYYFSVKVMNGGGLWSSVGTSDGIIVDTTGPTFSTIAATPDWVTLDTRVVLTFSSSETLADDPTVTVDGNTAVFLYKENNIDYTYMYTIAAGDSNPAPIAISGTDRAGNEGTGGNSTILKTYSESDYGPLVTDDGQETVDTSLHATWEPANPDFPPDEYEYAVGTSPGDNDMVDWTSTGAETEVTTEELALAVDTTYFISVRACLDGYWTEIGTSDGIKYVDFMLQVDDPRPCDLLCVGNTLPQTWDPSCLFFHRSRRKT
jgi:hypothetical protein